MAMAFANKVGILGGGQLARMLALKGHELGLEVHILSQHSSDPAAQVTRHWHQGDPNQISHLQKWAQGLDYLTFESEFYSGELLAQLQKKASVKIFPSPEAMKTLQDRVSQKILLAEHKINTSPFMAVNNAEDLQAAAREFKNKFVLKKRQGGYDGNGTFVVASLGQLKSLPSQLSISPNEFMAEAFVRFKRECAIIMARNSSGEILHFPLVVTEQKDNRCDYVYGPVRHPALNKLINKLAIFLEDIQYVGSIGFEFFDTGRELIVNEVAPRVHNTGHYSLEALNVDQFSLHWRAGLGMDFFEVKAFSKAFVMTNLIGSNSQAPQLPETLQGHLHWYGKQENRLGRKMGHVTYVGHQTTSLIKLALQERKKFINLK